MTNDDSPASNEESRNSGRFRFKCPQVWDRLQPNDVEGVRYCQECQRDVYLALTEEDFRKHSDEGRCIAVLVLRPNRQADHETPVYVVGMADGPYPP